MDKIRYRSDSEMVDSGVEWIGRIPRDWIVGGFTKYINPIIDYRGKTPEKVDEGIFLVTAKNIKQGKVDYTLSTEYIRRDKYKEVMSRGIPKIGDVLFTTEAPLGQVANVDKIEIALAQRIIKFDGLDIKLNNYFLKYLIMSDGFQQNLITYATGSTALGIKASKLSQLKIILADIQEQQKIANFLDIKTTQFDKIIAKKEQLIEKLEEAKKSLISEVVTGKVKIVDGKLVPRGESEMVDSGVKEFGKVPKYFKLSKIKFHGDFKAGISKSAGYFGTGYSFVSYSDVYNNKEILKGSGLAITSKKERIDFSIKEKDVFFTRTSESINDIGVSCICKGDIKDGAYSGFIIRYRLRNKENFDYNFIKYYFQNEIIKRYFANQLNIVTRASLSQERLKELPFILPKYEEQRVIGMCLESKTNNIKDIIMKTKTQIQKLKQAKQSLISEAVTGKIDLRDWEIIEKGE